MVRFVQEDSGPVVNDLYTEGYRSLPTPLEVEPEPPPRGELVGGVLRPRTSPRAASRGH